MMIRMYPGVIVAMLAMFLGACSAPGGSGYIDFSPVDSLQLAAVPALPGTGLTPESRQAAALESMNISPLDYNSSGGTVTDQAPDLLLDSQAQGMSWVLYNVDVSGLDLQELNLTIAYTGNQTCWVALGEFNAGRWSWEQISQTTASRTLSGGTGNYVSPLSRLYFVVLGFNDNDLAIQNIEIVHQTADPIPTYNADIAPLLSGNTGEKSCTGCHGGISPNLESYSSVLANANAVLSSVSRSSDFMPPSQHWGQDSIDLFQAWIDAGKPEM
ncbi:hypothetical protein KDL44_02150 [bacterium]|nr:hypothetical protein [bacterium]